MDLIESATLSSATDRARALETGNILFYRHTPFPFSDVDQQCLLAAVQTGSERHKNISYRPQQDRISGLESTGPVADRVKQSLGRFSENAVQCARTVLPLYAEKWKLDYASFRGIEEEGRDLPWKKRNDLLHTDAFPTRPTRGDLILRFFVNINPTRERVWVTSDPFESVAREYSASAALSRFAQPEHAHGWKRVAQALRLPIRSRSRYDEFMLGFHDALKKNDEFQRDCPKYRFHFPPGSAWMVFTDVVPHAVISGQYAVEQTFIISKDSLAVPESAPIRILERLSRQRATIGS